MIATLTRSSEITNASIIITGSKSISNRLLILQAIFPQISIENLSESDDTKVLQNALSSNKNSIDVHHAGTAMRFLTAYLSLRTNTEVVLTGSTRMQQRPIGILVESLRKLGANIEYELNEGFPPLKISAPGPLKNFVTIDANVSSQYISALMLLAPSLKNELEIKLKGKITSRPYIEMTLQLLKSIGANGSFENSTIKIESTPEIKKQTITVESDWSSASYFYSFVALSSEKNSIEKTQLNSEITLSNFKKDSLQGDAALIEIYKNFGVKTVFNPEENSITLSKSKTQLPDELMLNLADTPDIAQTIAVTCFGLGIGCLLTGLHTLKIKETDRLSAMKTELEKLGAKVEITENSIKLHPKFSSLETFKNTKNVIINTYEDHRMAMAFAPLSLLFPIKIEDPNVVSKSYPGFYDDLKKIGIRTAFS